MYGRALSEQKGVAPIHGDWKSQLRERDENHARVEEEREEGIGKTRSGRETWANRRNEIESKLRFAEEEGNGPRVAPASYLSSFATTYPWA